MLIVGASGFVGRHLVHHLQEQGHQVETWGRGKDSNQSVDLLGPSPLPTGSWDVVYHLAAHSKPGLPWSSELILQNLAMTARLSDHLETNNPGCRLIFASSGLVYSASGEPHEESDPIAPSNAYGLSKQLCENWLQSVRSNLNVIIVRAFNQIGPGLPRGLMVTDLMDRIKAGEHPIKMRGRNATRDYLDIRDAVVAFEKLSRAELIRGNIFNLCSGNPIRISDLISAILESMGKSCPVTFQDLSEDRLIGINRKIRKELDWSPTISIKESIRHLLESENSMPGSQALA